MNSKLFENAKEVDMFDDMSEKRKRESDIRSQIAMGINRKRSALGMSQSEFAKYLGVSQTMISKWENCEVNFTLKKMVELLSMLDLKIEISTNVKDTVTKNAPQYFVNNSTNYRYAGTPKESKWSGIYSASENHFYALPIY